MLKSKTMQEESKQTIDRRIDRHKKRERGDWGRMKKKEKEREREKEKVQKMAYKKTNDVNMFLSSKKFHTN